MPSASIVDRSEHIWTLAEIARHFSLPESTARYYCKRFAAFLPYTGEGRRRRYRQESLSVIAAIIEHMRTERTASNVEDVLARQFPRNLDATVTASPKVTFNAQIADVAHTGISAGEPVLSVIQGEHAMPGSGPGSVLPALAGVPSSCEGTLLPVGGGPFPVTADAVPILSFMEQQTAAMQGIAASLQQLARGQEAQRQWEERAHSLGEENRILRQEVESLRTMQLSAEKMHQEDMDKMRDWLTRMARLMTEARG